MCTEHLGPSEMVEYRKNLPDKFFVWKVITKRYGSLYGDICGDDSGIYAEPRILDAEYRPGGRCGSEHDIGFHAFLRRRDAECFMRSRFHSCRSTLKIKRFLAKRDWAKSVGFEKFEFEGKKRVLFTIVLSRIEVL